MPSTRELREFLRHARLQTYISPDAHKLRAGPLRILAYSSPGPPLLAYVDIYSASADERRLDGIELVLSALSEALLVVEYHGGVVADIPGPLNPRSVFDSILKPCRRNALQKGVLTQRGSVGGVPYAYNWKDGEWLQHEEISLQCAGEFVLVHEVTFDLSPRVTKSSRTGVS